jgi:hypothetical protein
VDQSRRAVPTIPSSTEIPDFLAQGRYRIARLIEGAKSASTSLMTVISGATSRVAFLKAERFDTSRLRRVREEAREMARLVTVYDVG